MIKANELRIGNYLTFKGSPRVNVKLDRFDLSAILYNKDEVLHYEPIKLTEEILLKCDEIVKNNSFYPYKFLNGLIKIRNGIYFFKYYGIEIELPFLHQLQNLFFALTNEELQFNL